MMTHGFRSDFFAAAARNFLMVFFFLASDDKLKLFFPSKL